MAIILDKYEVSNKLYGDFMKATDHPAPAYWDDHRRNKPEQPVSGVNWNDATHFVVGLTNVCLQKQNGKKQHGGQMSFKYPWGNDLDNSKANYGRKDEVTANIDAYPEGKSPYGNYNMSGNVFEWVSDWYDPNFLQNY